MNGGDVGVGEAVAVLLELLPAGEGRDQLREVLIGC